VGASHCKNCSHRDLLRFLHHRHTMIGRLVERFSHRTANNRSPPTSESRESHFVSRSIHAFHVLGGAVGAALYARYSSDLFVPRAGFLIDLSQNCASGQPLTLSLNVDGTCQGLSETSLPSPKRTLAAAATTTAVAAAAARAHQIPHTYLDAPSAMARPGFIVTDVRLQGECFVMRREPLSAKERIGWL
jgi:hypothetical protein